MKHLDLLKMFRQNKVKTLVLREVRNDCFQVEANAETLVSKRGGKRKIKLETAKKYLAQLGCKNFIVLLKDDNDE